ncbi:MAG: PD40 domain-containing protein [Bacteroidales bacterium]|nr:MAG: PD40 domain-containing protein [Bacteroidales bacterium]
MKRYIFTLMPLLMMNLAYPQESQDLDLALADGDFFFLDEDYSEALFNYLKLIDTDFMNDNIKFKIGYCYLNILGEEYKAIPFLEEAVQNTTSKYKRRSSEETRAPLHAYFHLAQAYHINNELDKALETYNLFKELPEFEDNYNLTIVDNEIKACEKAKIIEDIPLNIRVQNIGEPVNTGRNNYNPVINRDESFLVYVSELAFYDGIFTSKRTGGIWSEPENITPQIESDGDVIPTSISADGKEIYLVKGEGNNRDIHITRLGTDFWSRLEPLNENINSGRAESHASVSPDGQTLYFSSNRRGSIGGMDIWKSERTSSGDWGPAVNLGPEINTEYDEEAPFISQDGKILYFCSRGHYNMGNFDIFYSENPDGNEWSVPTNIGFPINTTGDDLFYAPIGDGNIGYMARIRPEGLGGTDIYRYEILPEDEESVAEFEGIIDRKGMEFRSDKDFEIKITDKFTNTVVAVIRYNKETGEFQYITHSGNYSFTIEER